MARVLRQRLTLATEQEARGGRCTGGILQPVPFCPNPNQLIIHAITIKGHFAARILVSDFYTLVLLHVRPFFHSASQADGRVCASQINLFSQRQLA
jgi:hypothetical protein